MKSTWIPTIILVLTSFLALLIGVILGPTVYSIQDIVHVIVTKMGLSTGHRLDVSDITIIWQIRLPRVLLAYMVGAGLSVVGLSMQTLVRNPLAEPYILGIASGASAGASLFYLGFLPPIISVALSLPLAAFLGSLITMVLVLFISYKDGELQITRLLLAGVAMASLMGAVSTFVTFASPDLEKMKTVMFWLLGSFSGSRWDLVLLPTIATFLALLFLMIFHRPLDALLLGEESAYHLGVPVQLFRWLLIGIAALVTGLLVASAGAIGFVGLIIPHSIRSLVGVMHRRVVPLSFFAGGIFMVLVDIAARTMQPGQELPIGMVTALCGAPFFLWLLRKNPYRFG